MTGRCPICSKPRDAGFKPFCSKRCADLDLARWLNGAYAIPSLDDDTPDLDAATPNPDPVAKE